MLNIGENRPLSLAALEASWPGSDWQDRAQEEKRGTNIHLIYFFQKSQQKHLF